MEKLITLKELCEAMRISRATFYRIRPFLIAEGLQEVSIIGRRRFRASSVERLIDRISNGVSKNESVSGVSA